MNMARLPRLMARTPEDKPDWTTEIVKAVLLAAAVWAATAYLSGRGENEHRFTTLEVKVETQGSDIQEIKRDVKDILKAVK